MNTQKQNRRKYFVDSQVQGGILKQAALFWLLGSLTFAGVVCIYRIIPSWLSGEVVDFPLIRYHLAPMLVSSAILFPIVMFRAIRFSHRFVGPVVRFRSVMKQLSRGEPGSPIRLRGKDFWFDVANELNAVSEKFNEISSRDEKKHEELVSSQ